MNIGSLYTVKKYFWLIFPTKEIAAYAFAVRTLTSGRGEAEAYAEYWSKKFNCNVSYISPNSIFCLLEKDEKYCKILSTNGELGWIILANWYKNDIEEVKV